MSTKLSILCIVGTACVAISAAQELSCSDHPKFSSEGLCCPIPNIFTPEIRASCEEFNFPYDSHDNTTHPHMRLHHHRYHHPCMVQCELAQTGMIDANGTLNETQMARHLAIVLKDFPELIPVKTEALRVCVAEGAQFRAEGGEEKDYAYHDYEVPYCSHLANRILHCAFQETSIHCPNGTWTNTKNCNDSRTIYMGCKDNIHYWRHI